MQIILDTSKPLTSLQRNILQAVLNHDGAWPEVPVSPASPSSAPPAEPAPAVVEQPKPATPPSPASPQTADSPEEASASPTVDDALKVATQLLSENRMKDVKAALKTQGVAKVSDLKPNQVQGFLDALEAL